MRLRKKRAVLGVAVFALLLAAYLSICLRASTPADVQPQSAAIPEPDGYYSTSLPIVPNDPNYKPDPYHGEKGYLTIDPAPGTADSLRIKRDGFVTLTLLLRVFALVPNFTEARVIIDPNNEWATNLDVSYAGGLVNINKLVSYDPSGNLTIRAGQTVQVKMTIAAPRDLPFLQNFYLPALGIMADVPTIDNLVVIVYG